MSKSKRPASTSARKKSASSAPSAASSLGAIREIPFQAFLNDFRRIHEDAKAARGQRCCFILGAGASFESGIRLAGALCDDWLRDLHSEAPHDGLSLEKWATATSLSIPGFTWEKRAECYGQLFARRFQRERDRGQRWLENEMEGAHPSWGYNILVQLLNTHPVVVTTNFDSLVADAIHLTGGRAPLTIPHEDLARQIPDHPARPVILKLHRDLFYTPKNADGDIATLPEAWKGPLTRIFREYIPIFLGYGGHDGSLMGFLNSLPPDVPSCAYWLEMNGAPINPDVRRFLDGEYRFLVRHDGFDITMRRIQEHLGLEDPQKILSSTHDQRIGRLSVQEGKLNAEYARLTAAISHDHGPLSEEALTAEAEAIGLLVDQVRYAEAEARLASVERLISDSPENGDTRARLLVGHARGRLLSILSPGTPAYTHYQTLLGRCRLLLGIEDPLVLKCRNNLANALWAQGKDAEAEAENRTVLAIRERVLGSEHPDTLASRNNLALALGSQRKHAEAEAEHRAVLAIQERVMGPEHPDTLSSRNNLALALRAEGKHAEAEAEHRAVLAIRERVQGPEHPDTLSSRNNLANSLRAEGKHAEAEAENRAVLAIRERVQGPEHPDTLKAQLNLALSLKDLKNWQEAVAEAERALAGRRKVLGEGHPETKSAERVVAEIKRKQAEAEGKEGE